MKTFKQFISQAERASLAETTEPSTSSLALQLFNKMKVVVAQVRGTEDVDDLLAGLSELIIMNTAAQYLSLGETLKDKQIRSMARMLGNL